LPQILVVSMHRQFTALIQWATNPLQTVSLGRVAVVDGTLPELEVDVVDLVHDSYRVLVYGGVLHSSRVLRLMDLGVRGYVPETATLPVLLAAVKSIAADGTHLPFDPASGRNYVPLTTAEEVAADAYFLNDEELPRSEVAKRLGIADSTLRNQLASVRRKLGIPPQASRTAVARRYRATVRQAVPSRQSV
jgi:DNA-binding NarL/FixJ family response regulator